MNRYFNYCNLYYSPIMSLPIVGNSLYFFQIQLLRFGIFNFYIASNKKAKERILLFKEISKKYKLIFCKSTHFARNLQIFRTNDLILDTPKIENVSKMTTGKLYDLMWSLVFCNYVTAGTKKVLSNFLPPGFVVV